MLLFCRWNDVTDKLSVVKAYGAVLNKTIKTFLSENSNSRLASYVFIFNQNVLKIKN